jgi:hypothetical protein
MLRAGGQEQKKLRGWRQGLLAGPQDQVTDLLCKRRATRLTR